jgi:hypothetical protein
VLQTDSQLQGSSWLELLAVQRWPALHSGSGSARSTAAAAMRLLCRHPRMCSYLRAAVLRVSAPHAAHALCYVPHMRVRELVCRPSWVLGRAQVARVVMVTAVTVMGPP